MGKGPFGEQMYTVARRDRECVVLVVRGEVDIATVGRLRDAVDEALAAPEDIPVVVDLTQVDFFASAGIGILLAVTRAAGDRGRPLRIVVDENRAVLRPLQVAGVDRILELYASLDEAVAPD
jgi:anti-sigma B factor antagonist